jgi:hypothetical protein
MILPDVNVLVHAHNADSAAYQQARHWWQDGAPALVAGRQLQMPLWSSTAQVTNWGSKMSEIPRERLEAYKQQTNDEYAALGRYVQAFEDVCERLRIIVVFLLARCGLRNQVLARILVEHENITALPLLKVTRAMMQELYGENKDAMKILKQLYDDFEPEIRRRNHYLHGSWRIGWGNLTEREYSSDSLAHKAKFSPKDGFWIETVVKSVEQLRGVIDRLEEIGSGFSRLDSCLLGGFEVLQNFELVDGRYVSPDIAKKRGWRGKRASDPNDTPGHPQAGGGRGASRASRKDLS